MSISIFLTTPKKRLQSCNEENSRVSKRHGRTIESGGWHLERQYVDHLVAFDEVHALGLLTAFRDPPSNDHQFADFFQDFRRQAEIASQKILIEAARRLKVNADHIVVLNSTARKTIHALISAIREKLNEMTLPENLRQSLFNKLDAFAAEVDRNRTRTDAFFAFAVETSKAARQVNDELKPIQQTIDRIFEWIEKATNLKDALPPWDERKRIEPPKKRLPSPNEQSDLRKEIDDEIPF